MLENVIMFVNVPKNQVSDRFSEFTNDCFFAGRAEEQSNINPLDIVKSLEITSAYVDKLASVQ